MNKFKKMAVSNVVSLCLSIFFVNKSSLYFFQNDEIRNYYDVLVVCVLFFGFKYIFEKSIGYLFPEK
ncbi:exported hypothetical protein [Xenorhabdus innexi]|uniref:Uncharacterized protein n=1 Tax=Xenorhabdus innexi TaxID=290109 RepID=A0A2G0N0W4_9GAMM|nr:exported hypothetical protein [Xenorhabdus innexi]